MKARLWFIWAEPVDRNATAASHRPQDSHDDTESVLLTVVRVPGSDSLMQPFHRILTRHKVSHIM